jgi:hypothetical protein
MMLEVGKLYSCSEYFLLLFPDKDTARRCSAIAERDIRYADIDAAYWTRELGKPVSYCNPQTPLLVLSVKEQYIEVLAGDKRGWIIYQGWLNIKDIR